MAVKSLLVTYDFPPIISGIGSFFYNTWKFMPGRSSIILAPAAKGSGKFDKGLSVKVFRYVNFSQSPAIRTLILFFYLPVLMLREKINVLICGVPVSLGLLGLVFNRITGVPYCVFYYGGEFDKYKKNRVIMGIIKSVVNNAEYVITNSSYSSQEVGRFGIDKHKIVKITPGVDTDKFFPLPGSNALKDKYRLHNKKVLLTVARLVKRKGIESVICALPKVIKVSPEVAYIIVGKGPEEHRLKKLVQEKELADYVIFAGFVADERLSDYYNLCDVYVMPNIATQGDETLEGFGISFIEASACGKPCIGGISGGASDAVEDGKTGFLIDPNNTDMLAEKILGLINDDKLRFSLGECGRQKTTMDFKWEDRASRLEETLEKVNI